MLKNSADVPRAVQRLVVRAVIVLMATLVLLAIFSAITLPGGAQRQRRPMVTSLSASIDKDGPHPDKAEIKEPGPITCISTITDDPKSLKPACKITAPGFNGILNEGEKANATGAGSVTLSCTGMGSVRCRARIN